MMRIPTLQCLMFMLLACAGLRDGQSQEREHYLVGVAKVDITPDYPIRLNGFGFRREESEGVSQHIFAKALAISAGNEPPLVLLAIDSLGVRLPMVDEVAKRLRDQFGIPRENVALTFSHSHCTPKVNGAADNIFSQPIPADHQEHIDRYTRELTDWLEKAAVAAIQDRQPAQLAWSVGKVGFAKNRRTPGGPVDHDLPMLVVRDKTGKPRAIYVTYACHCVTLSFNKLSGDWSGYAQELIERRFPGAVGLVSIGCGSDSNPQSGVTGDKTDIATAQGAEIADEVARLMEGELKPVTGPIKARLQLLDLALNDPPTREQLLALARAGGPAGYNAQTQLARLDRGEALLRAIQYPVQTFTFGESLHMVFLAGEVCVDYSLRLKRELRSDRVWINAYSNDFSAYIPSERLLKEGGYGGGGEIPYFALPATLKPGLEQRIIDEVQRQTPPPFVSDAGKTQGVAPKSPQESLQSLKTHDDLRIELVASEPLVVDPVAIDFGPDGKLWVVEMVDYARGVNDEFEPRGRVRFLTDTNQDGQFDQSTEFLGGLRFPTDVKLWRKGVLVCDAPDILYAEDTDGDGRADIRKKLFSGFATHNPHGRVNSLRYGLDNWLYGSGGLFGGKITSFNGQTVDVSNRDFRMNPDSGVIEPVTGYTQQGRPRDDWDNWFGCTNGSLLNHYIVEDRYARRNPHVAPPTAARYVPDYPDSQRLFPRGDLVLFKLSGAPGRPTSACGLEIYRDDLLGSEYYGNAFTCEPVNQLVHREVVSRQGASFSSRRAANETDTEFLTSTDRWFRPVQVRTGPDGALWIVDMYRYVIEHPQWIPPETIAQINVFAGQQQGRIYRIVPKSRGARTPQRFDQLNNSEIAAALDSPNGPQRDLAQQLLVWREAADAAQALEQVAQNSSFPAARLQALATLDGLHRLTPQAALPLLQSEHPELRRHGVRLLEQFLKKDDSQDLLTSLLRLMDDPDLNVRIQLAQTLGESRSESAAEGLAILAANAGEDPYLTGAILSSVRADNVVGILRALASQTGGDKPLPKIAEPLLGLAAATGDESILSGTLEQVVNGGWNAPPAWQWEVLGKVIEAASRRNVSLKKSLADATQEKLRVVATRAAETAASPNAPEPDRVAAVELLGRSAASRESELFGSQPDRLELLAQLCRPNQPPALQTAAVKALSQSDDEQAAQLLLAAWETATPRLKNDVLNALLSRERGISSLLAALERSDIRPQDLDATRRERLLSHANVELRQRAERLFASSSQSDRKELLAQWQPVASLNGDKTRGQEVFRKHCATCHQLDGFGTNVGPDLAALTTKSSASLLVAILDPHRDVDGRYVNYVAQLADGRTITGLLASESGNSVTLREQGGKDHVILRQDLEELRATGRSVMPEGLEKDINHSQMADVIAYLLEPRVSPKSFRGNQPRVVTADAHGSLSLTADAAEIYGQEIAFESDSPYRNIGYWHGKDDRVGWQIQLMKPGRYDVYLDYSCADESAGNRFRMDGAEPTLRGDVAGTGGWSNYRIVRVGTIELAAGRSYLSVAYDGEPKRPALFDLRALHLVPSGTAPAFAAADPKKTVTTLDPASVAQALLDDQKPAAEREKLVADHPADAAAIIAAMAADMPNDPKEEYRRIPWIWRVAIATGKRNFTEELRSVLQVSLPAGGQPLRDWQAVVVGGGIINGVSQAGEWPKTRLEDVMKVDGPLVAKWQRAIELAAAMADDEKVAPGTRYDALRMIAMGTWDLRGAQLQKYLAAGVNDELQMGAVSGLADMQSPHATTALINSLKHLSQRNRELALDGLLRSSERARALLDAVAQGKVPPALLDEKRRARLLEHPEDAVRKRAAEVLQ